MKTLIIVRHAKSDWHLHLSDFERPLNSRGKNDAPEMAQRVKSKSLKIDALVHSAAVRTTETAHYFVEVLNISHVISEPSIYEAELDNLTTCVSWTEASIQNLMLIGHNPGVSELIYYYTGQSLEMVTCAMACISFDVDEWSSLSRNSGQLIWFDFPKNE